MPLVSPMVVPLGAAARGPSATLTAQLPLTGDQPIQWSPELQLAPWDGVGLELLASIEDDDVVAVQAAGQVTLGRLGEGYIHGMLLAGGVDPDSGDAAVGIFYLPGYRIDEVFSVQALIGAETAVEHDRGTETLAVANVATFAAISPTLTLSLEAVAGVPTRGGSSRDWELLVMPEVLWGRGRWSFGAGLGPLFTRGETDAVAVASVGIAF